MKHYTVLVEYGNGNGGWSARYMPQDVDTSTWGHQGSGWNAEQVADTFADDITRDRERFSTTDRKRPFRIRVWEGWSADTGKAPLHEYISVAG